MSDRIRLIAFALYGTLIDIDALAIALRPFTKMPEALRDAWRQRLQQLMNATSSPDRFVDFDRVAITALHDVAPRFLMQLDGANMKAAMDAWARLPAYDDVIPALTDASASGIPMVVLTNAVESTAENALAHAGIRGFFSHVFCAHAVRTYKPKPACYDQLKSLGVEPSEILMITANDWDATGARQAGLHTIWLNRKRTTTGPKAERSVNDLTELEFALQSYELTAL